MNNFDKSLNEKSTYWYSLIQLLKTKGEIKNGVTIPFLIGAYRLVNIGFENNKSCIHELLSEIYNSTTELKPVLQNCDDIRQYVIGLKTKDFCDKNFKNEFTFKNKAGEKTLIVTQNANSLGNDIESISNSLYQKYHERLQNETYSWRPYKENWEEFNDKEINLIKQSKR